MTKSLSRKTLMPILTLWAMICLGVTACEVVEALDLFPMSPLIQRQAGVFLPLLWVWARIEKLMEAG